MRKLFWIIFLLFNLSACRSQEHPYTNALINETSPYLLQHAHNPVNWNPWGEAALEQAKKDNKLLVISVGYAACHWCHVMEDESFEDEAVAKIMNDNFVAIKVDREERPDVDAIYLSACELVTGAACGWPLNVFALPDGRPVWAGTYFPKKKWVEILNYFVKLYQEEPDKLEDYAGRLTQGIQDRDELQPIANEDVIFKLEGLESMVGPFLQSMDKVKGGRKGAPKFPIPNIQEFLLQWHFYTGDEEALQIVETSLDQMAKGGIYDHLAGGFARYSTDDVWKVPHFEKMLYDNGQLVSLYAKAFAFTGKAEYQSVVEESLEFIANELTDDSGGFYSSLDADSEGEEGKFYVWSKEELDQLLDKQSNKEAFFDFYQISTNGNWEEEKNILYHTEELEEFAKKQNLDPMQLKKDFADIKNVLLKARNKRTRPGLDDKVLVSWNALMLQGYLDAYRYLGKAEYLQVAEKNANFLLQNLKDKDHRLDRTYKEGQSKINAFLDDYALLAQALVSMYEVSFDEKWLYEAKNLTDYAIAHFYDEEKGVFNYTSDLDPPLITRKVELIDNAVPGSNSAMANVLYKLSLLFYNKDYQTIAKNMLLTVQPMMQESGSASFYSNWLQLYLSMVKQPYEIAIVGKEYSSLQKEFQMQYLPNAIFLGGKDEGSLELLNSKLQSGETFIYVCKDKLCKLPVQEVNAAVNQMEK